MNRLLSVASRFTLVFCLMTHTIHAMQPEDWEQRIPKTQTNDLEDSEFPENGTLKINGRKLPPELFMYSLNDLLNNLKRYTHLTSLSIIFPTDLGSIYASIKGMDLSHLTNLTELRIEDAPITDADLSTLTKLKNLHWRNNKWITNDSLRMLPGIITVEKLDELDRKRGLHSLEPHMELDRALKTRQLNVPSSKRAKIRFPGFETFDDYINLTDLELNDSRDLIVCLLGRETHSFNVNSLTGLTNLTKLGLEGNWEITYLPESLIKNLKYLNLRENYRITDSCLSKFTNLTFLNLKQNEMITDNSLRTLTNLEGLNLYQNIKITGDALLQLLKLRDLDLSTYRTIVNPKELAQLTNLERLVLDFNSNIPYSTLQALTNLTDLSIQYGSGIKGDVLPDLPKLTSLNVSNRSLPSTLLLLTNLQRLGCYESEFNGIILKKFMMSSELQLLVEETAKSKDTKTTLKNLESNIEVDSPTLSKLLHDADVSTQDDPEGEGADAFSDDLYSK